MMSTILCVESWMGKEPRIGRGEGIRTLDLLLKLQALYRAELPPNNDTTPSLMNYASLAFKSGGAGGFRTPDFLLATQALYP